MYAILAQTGGLKCAFQVPIFQELVRERIPDLIVGNSGGALNGVLASQGDLNLLEDLWLSVGELAPWRWQGNSWDIIERIKLILSSLVWRSRRGLYDLTELRVCIDQMVSLKKLRTEFACGVVSRETSIYHNLVASSMKSDRELQEAVLASSAIAGLFAPVDLVIDGKNHTCSDGGHLHTIPLIPKMFRDNVKEIDLIMTYPVVRQTRSSSEVNGMWRSMEWALEIALTQAQIHGLRQIRHMAERGVRVRIFSPEIHLGGLLEGNDDIIQNRMRLGRKALEHPIIWDQSCGYMSEISTGMSMHSLGSISGPIKMKSQQ